MLFDVLRDRSIQMGKSYSIVAFEVPDESRFKG
jgi:hypothetical protein